MSEKAKIAYEINFDIDFNDLLNMAIVKLGLGSADKLPTKMEALQRLKDFVLRQFSDGGNVALIVDKARNLNQKAMENLRLLSNLKTPRYKLVQIVLCGQPVLEAKLARPELRRLTERISNRRAGGRLNTKPINSIHLMDPVKFRRNSLAC